MRREGYLKQVILYNFPLSFQAWNGVKWWEMENLVKVRVWESDGTMEEEESELWWNFSKSHKVINLLTIIKLLIAKPPLDQSQKSKLKP